MKLNSIVVPEEDRAMLQKLFLAQIETYRDMLQTLTTSGTLFQENIEQRRDFDERVNLIFGTHTGQ